MNYVLILAGGFGTRFWPLSRKSHPKQLLTIVGGESFLQAAVHRAKKEIPAERIFVITSKIYQRQILGQLKKFRIPPGNIILEPSALNTLPAISLSARLISLKDPEANFFIMPADHYIKNPDVFCRNMRSAFEISRQGYICLIGIKPDSPATGYGYIRSGIPIKPGIFKVSAFIEKPACGKARRLIRQADIFWNSGILCFSWQTLFKSLELFQPGLYAGIRAITRPKDILLAWSKLDAISFDYGILEKSRNLAMIKAGFFWRDLGSWDSLCEILPQDRDNNIVVGKCVGINNKNTLIYSSGKERVVAALGLEDLIIVDTADALLVCKKGASQEVRDLVNKLSRGRYSCV